MQRLVRTLAGVLSLSVATTALAAPKKKKPAPPPAAETPPEEGSASTVASDKTPEKEAIPAQPAATEPAPAEPSKDAAGEGDKDKGPSPDGKVEGADDTLDTYEGVGSCSAFEDKNQHDMHVWEKSQPPVPYKYEERKTFLGAPWSPLTQLDSDSGQLLLATFVPHLDALLRGANPAIGFSWPWSIPIGPAAWCTRQKGSYDIRKYKPLRLLVEPGFYAEKPVTFWVRPGARFMWHPTEWYFGIGAGMGSTIELVGKEPLRASLSPEIIATLGRCCNPGYFTLAARHDFFLEGKTQTTVVTFGYTYF